LEREIDEKNRRIDGLGKKIGENEEEMKNKNNRMEEAEIMIR